MCDFNSACVTFIAEVTCYDCIYKRSLEVAVSALLLLSKTTRWQQLSVTFPFCVGRTTFNTFPFSPALK